MCIVQFVKGSSLLLGCTLLYTSVSYAAEPLDDSELARITGQGYEVDTSVPNMIGFNFHDLGARKGIDGSGNMELRTLPQLSPGNNSITLSDNAQSNLSALMNINAANAVIQVLMNLNINIDSEVGSLIQQNSASGL